MALRPNSKAATPTVGVKVVVGKGRSSMYVEKLHSLLVRNFKLINDIGLVLVEELQCLTDEERGPVLEILLTRILLNPKHPQIVGLSAVLGKSEDPARWLRAGMIREEKRPVELRQGVFFLPFLIGRFNLPLSVYFILIDLHHRLH
jgi:hypothetical protein